MRSTARTPKSRTLDRLVPDGFCACPVDIAFEVVGRKWTVLLIRNMLRGQTHFNEFLANMQGLSPRTLSARLKELEQEQLVEKRVTKTTPLSIEYRLTAKGHAVLPILEQMVRWSLAWAPERVLSAGATERDLEACVAEWESMMREGGSLPDVADGVARVPVAPPRRKLTRSTQ